MNDYPKGGFFGKYGGRYVGESLVRALDELKEASKYYLNDDAFLKEYYELLQDYAGRPSPITFARRFSSSCGQGVRIYLKREDLNHTGAHKINNTIGQILLAVRMGKKEVIAETGAGQHGVATATVAALFGLPCKIFMGKEDVRRQAPNVRRMELLGAEVVSVESGTSTLKDAMNEAMRYWAEVSNTTFYIIGTAAGPHPYPWIVREFQKVIGEEARDQFLKKTGKLPDQIIASVGGGSNAIGIFYPFLKDLQTELTGVEAGGKGKGPGEHCASLNFGSCGILHGTKTSLLQNADGQILDGYSISAGLDYPGVGPEHASLRDSGRVRYQVVGDEEALSAFEDLSRLEGIIPAFESAHAVAQARKESQNRKGGESFDILINLSGRGDKDIDEYFRLTSLKKGARS
ncbi:MAG: tryptophan synthase subunit beta [Planctomycetia bacterium]|nr:tryptophan synthase subunit beta [Planctomycetia bacterium]